MFDQIAEDFLCLIKSVIEYFLCQVIFLPEDNALQSWLVQC